MSGLASGLDWLTGLHGYLAVAASLFVLGAVAVISRKNAIGVLLGVELMLNAAGLNFVIFSKYRTAAIDGQIVALFIIFIAAAEAAVALAIILRFYRLKHSMDASEANLLRD
ncbi:MAG: NADH-quinone oxidoreductase subunit NuoK [Deltaproteobacteria bacterium]|nr:NADH-quinone oxidoreductase subunit NuoK [Deltaproteobacteria bacterium]MBI3295462.1 NADH-quinone oxidoreductase subunit NuoK [Deltaproteobacteria bacterium]